MEYTFTYSSPRIYREEIPCQGRNVQNISLKLIFFILISLTTIKGQEGSHKTVAVLPLSGMNIPNQELAIFSERLDAELFSLNGYTFVERELMSEILKEQGFQQSGCTTDECAVQIGELLGVKFLITGSLGYLSGLYTITIKMIDVESGEIKVKFSYDCECSSKDFLLNGIKSAVITGFSNEKRVLPSSDKRLKSNYIIRINSRPENARVHIGGKYVGKTPISLADYKNGNYTMMVMLPGYKIHRSRVMVSSKNESILVELEKK